MVDSANHRQTSWMPTGSPSLLAPNRNVIAGRPVRLNGDVVLKICRADTVAPLITNFDNPCGCAGIGVTGQRKASYFWKKASRTSNRTFEKVPKMYEFERKLLKATKRIVSVLALGKPGEQVGIGRIFTDEEEWRATATTLIDQAACVLCIPSAKTSTLWEIDFILTNNHLS